MMKKNYFLLLFLCSFPAFAQNINFADPNFKARLLLSSPFSSIAKDINENFVYIDTNFDNEIQESEALLIYRLEITGANISSLAGIEYFPNLIALVCNSNNLTSLPIGSLTGLKGLLCDHNQLTSLAEIENMVPLETLSCGFNPITAIHLQNLHHLKVLKCPNTSLTEINLCGTVTTMLWCPNNPNLQSLKVKNGVVSPIQYIPSRMLTLTPPPLFSFDFMNLPALNYVCYDDGEYDTVIDGLLSQPITNITFTTECSDCSVLASQAANLEALSLYPNPATNTITIGNTDPIAAISIYNTLGQCIESQQNQHLEQTLTLNIFHLKIGTYFIEITSGKGKTTKKFIKL